MLEFVIPVSRSDLLTHSSSSYWVNDIVSVRQLSHRVHGKIIFLVDFFYFLLFRFFKYSKFLFSTRLLITFLMFTFVFSTILDCQRTLAREGPLGITQYFDTLFSVLQ